MKRLMVVDSLNLFLRNFIVNPSLTINGSPCGGLLGTIRSLQKLIRDVKPDEIIFAFDGEGGSQKKRLITSSYKEGRKPIIRLNRGSDNLSESESDNNMQWQQIRLYEYLNQMPIIQFLEKGIEADDLIALVIKHPKYKDWNRIIVSSDKDFIQLCDESTILYRPMQNDIKTLPSVIKEFGIHPCNFALARALDGDKSDNIKGVNGVGLITITKYLPFLSESKSYLIDEVKEFCEQKVKEKAKTKFYQTFLDNLDLIKTNYSLMQLYSPNLSVQVVQKTRNTIDNFIPELNQTEIKMMMIKDGFDPALTFEEMFGSMRKIVRDFNDKKHEIQT